MLVWTFEILTKSYLQFSKVTSYAVCLVRDQESSQQNKAWSKLRDRKAYIRRSLARQRSGSARARRGALGHHRTRWYGFAFDSDSHLCRTERRRNHPHHLRAQGDEGRAGAL